MKCSFKSASHLNWGTVPIRDHIKVKKIFWATILSLWLLISGHLVGIEYYEQKNTFNHTCRKWGDTAIISQATLPKWLRNTIKVAARIIKWLRDLTEEGGLNGKREWSKQTK